MPVDSPPSKTCSNCNRSQLSSPFCPACGAPTYTPSRGDNDPAPPPAARPVDSFPPPPPPPSRKTPLWVKVLAIIGGLFVTMIVGCAALVGSAVHEVDTEGGNSSRTFSPSKGDGADDSPSEADSTFKNGVLRTPDLKIKITRYKIIEAGQKGNEYGKKPVIAFWYKTTNLSGAKVDPTDAVLDFTAYQDNNPNAENELEVGALPDDRFLHSQLENIKKGGTVENAMAYELDDLDTPVDLVAIEGLDEVIGKATYRLR
jgi:hypothetical protein